MLEMRPCCETCGKDLPADEPGAVICSFECTFCKDCGRNVHKGTCPNCGGGFYPRPLRKDKALAKHPASKERIINRPA
jgi:hypothetical protein